MTRRIMLRALETAILFAARRLFAFSLWRFHPKLQSQ
jgi:hypothetical protein